jgi:transcriptional regulator with XRE-family HTH domain
VDNDRKYSLGVAIRIRREELGLTQEELAERIGEGVRQTDIARLERDQIQLPRPDRFGAIARSLELSARDLLIRAGWDAGELDDLDFPDDSANGEARDHDGAAVTIPRHAELANALRRLREALDDATASGEENARLVEDAQREYLVDTADSSRD